MSATHGLITATMLVVKSFALYLPSPSIASPAFFPAVHDVYLACIQPVAEYASLVWGAGLHLGDVEKLERIQR